MNGEEMRKRCKGLSEEINSGMAGAPLFPILQKVFFDHLL